MNTLGTLIRTAVGAGLLLTACSTASSQSESSAARGQILFTEYGCHGCHTVRGAGTPIATDLTHVGAKYGEADLARRVRDPSLHQPGAHMPKLPIEPGDVGALAAYLATLR